MPKVAKYSVLLGLATSTGNQKPPFSTHPPHWCLIVRKVRLNNHLTNVGKNYPVSLYIKCLLECKREQENTASKIQVIKTSAHRFQTFSRQSTQYLLSFSMETGCHSQYKYELVTVSQIGQDVCIITTFSVRSWTGICENSQQAIWFV